MVVRTLVYGLMLPDARSLKDKRSVVRSLKQRLRNRFNVSVAETGHHDRPTQAEVSLAFVVNDGREADALAERIDGFIASTTPARIQSVLSDWQGRPHG